MTYEGLFYVSMGIILLTCVLGPVVALIPDRLIDYVDWYLVLFAAALGYAIGYILVMFIV